MTPSGQESAQPGQPPAGGGAAARLAKAASALQSRLDEGVWGRLDVRTKSCLVTSQLFQEILEEIWSDQERKLERARKRAGELEAPMVDFSPVVLCLFKALEIEIERKVLRPFRESLPPALRDGLSETDWLTQELAALARFVRHGKPTPSLKVSATLFPALRACRANRDDLLALLKRWMRANLERPNRWWRDGKLCQRLQYAVDVYRNAAAHTGRLTPLEAQKATEELWGRTSQGGLVPTVLRAIACVPVGRTEAAPDPGGPPPRAELRKDLAVRRVVLLKPTYWLLDAEDQEMGDALSVALVPGDFEAVKSAADEFRARRQVVDEYLVPLVKWFAADPQWGRRVGVTAQLDESGAVAGCAKGGAAAEDGPALALALAHATAALHKAGFVHGFISPYTVFRAGRGPWRLGGQALSLLARRGCSVYAHPRTTAPEVKRSDVSALSAASDVFAIAATVCCLRAGRAERGAGAVGPAEVEPLFPSGPIRAALSRALSPKPASRHADAVELLAALTGQVAAPAPNRPHPVMLSYARKDAPRAEQLVADLAARGIRVWRDTAAIPGGTSWMERIDSAIENCRAVIFLASKNALASTHVETELSIAFNHRDRKPIVPIHLEPVDLQGAFRYMLGRFQHLEFFKHSRAENVDLLVQALAVNGVTPERER